MNQHFNILVPITESTLIKSENGGIEAIKIKGIATDHKRDVDDEVIKASDNPLSLDYLNECGVLNYDHSTDIVGRITKARFVDQDEARKSYGKPIQGTAVEIEGIINSIPQGMEAIVPKGLKDVHYYSKTGHPLFFSIQGTVKSKSSHHDVDGSEVKHVCPAVINQVAVTTQPKNTNAVCVIAKSLAELSLPVEEIEELDKVEKSIIVIEMESLDKSMQATGIIPTDGTTGADALKSDGMGSSTTFDPNKKPKMLNQDIDCGDGNGGVECEESGRMCKSMDNPCCTECKKEGDSSHQYCPHCGAKYEETLEKSLLNLVGTLRKSQEEAEKEEFEKGLLNFARNAIQKIGRGGYHYEQGGSPKNPQGSKHRVSGQRSNNPATEGIRRAAFANAADPKYAEKVDSQKKNMIGLEDRLHQAGWKMTDDGENGVAFKKDANTKLSEDDIAHGHGDHHPEGDIFRQWHDLYRNGYTSNSEAARDRAGA